MQADQCYLWALDPDKIENVNQIISFTDDVFLFSAINCLVNVTFKICLWLIKRLVIALNGFYSNM